MKRTAIVGVVILIAVLAVSAYAYAVDGTVNVTARVNPTFSMTLDNNLVDFGPVDAGVSYPMPAAVNIRVKSNKLWDYSGTEVALHEVATPANTYPGFLTQAGTAAFGAGQARGVTDDARSYTLDLTPDGAYLIPADVDLAASFTYTAVQQP